MKYQFLLIPAFAITLSSCTVANMINQSTYDIDENTDAIERSTEAVYENLAELEKIKQDRN